MCKEKEVDAAIRDLNLLGKHIGNNVTRVIYLTLAIFFGHHFLGFPNFAPSGTLLQLIVIGAVAAIGLGLGWVVSRSHRRMSLLVGENECDKGSDA
jgi:hypothetical protein